MFKALGCFPTRSTTLGKIVLCAFLLLSHMEFCRVAVYMCMCLGFMYVLRLWLMWQGRGLLLVHLPFPQLMLPHRLLLLVAMQLLLPRPQLL